MQALFLVFAFVLGACLGSFLCCQARRLRLRELADTDISPRPHSHSSRAKSAHSPRTKTTSARAKHPATLGPRSVCLSCGRPLRWYDNIPILSWLILRGRCRSCHAKIGLAEPLSELGLALAFVLLSLGFDPTAATALAWVELIVTLIFTAILAFLAIYDGLYGELPSLCLTFSIICAIIIVILKQWSLFSVDSFSPNLILMPLGSVALLGGVYLILYLVSRGRWVGDGDWLLGLALGLALSSPWLALITLFLANALACLVSLPAMLKPHQSAPRIHLGPFLVAAFVLTQAFAAFFCQWQPNML